MAAPDPFAALQDKLDSLVDAALVNRPDLAGKVADLRAQEAATMRAKADFFPEIRFEGTYHYDTFDFRARDPATKARGTFSGNQNQFEAFLGVDWDLFEAQNVVPKDFRYYVSRSATTT